MEPVLTTKLRLPLGHPNLVSRSHLIRKLDENLWLAQGARFLRRLTLVAAPAGYGKTTLLREWAAHLEIPVAWVTFEDTDNDPGRFLQYVIAALQSVQPGLGETALAFLRSAQSAGIEAIALHVAAMLVDEIAAAARAFLLVFDDYHALQAREIHLAVRFWLDHLPENLSLVIATRADPPLSLSRLRARRQMVEVRSEDLRFSESEAEVFLRQVMHLAIQDADVSILAGCTEGWIAGLQMAALALQGRPDPAELIRSFSGRDRFVIDYLFEEVLSRQPEDIRAFLIRTSVLDRMTGPLCDAVLGGPAAGDAGAGGSSAPLPSGRQTLEYLERANLFLVPLDHERRTYRYHQLFGELLRHDLQHKFPGEIPALHTRAAEWFETHGDVANALDHWLAAGNYQKAALLIATIGYRFLEEGSFSQLLVWLRQIPQDLVHSNLWLCIFYSWGLIFTGRAEEGEAYISSAEQRLPPVDEASDPAVLEQLAHIAVVREYLAAIRQDAAGIARHAGVALKYLPHDDLSLRGIVTALLGTGRLIANQFDLAEAAYADAARLGREAGNALAGVGALCALANLVRLKGELHRAYDMYEEAGRLVTDEQGTCRPVAAEAFAGRARVHYEWNELEAAEQDVSEARKVSRHANFDLDVDCARILSRLRLAQGDLDTAEQLIQELASGAGRSSFRLDLALLATRMNLHQARGDLAGLARLAAQQDWRLENKSLYAWSDAFIAYARFLASRGRTGEAVELLEQCLEKLQACGLQLYVIKALVAQACIVDSRGDHTPALEKMRRALSLAEPEAFIRIFVDQGEPARSLILRLRPRLAQAAGTEQEAADRLLLYADRLLSAFPAAPVETVTAHAARGAPSPDLIDPLTEREREVMRLIAAGCSNKEIAERLVVSLGTVKAHTTNIYRKLDVPGRTRAIARARELHII